MRNSHGLRGKPKPNILEADVKADAQTYLKSQGFRFLRTNTGLAWRRGFPMRQAPVGWPDLTIEIPPDYPVRNYWTDQIEVCPYARIGYIETKKPGKQLEPPQVAFRDECIRLRAAWWTVKDAEQLRHYIPPHSDELDLAVWEQPA